MLDVRLKYLADIPYISDRVYNIECKFNLLKEEMYTNKGGNYLLECEGLIETDVYLKYDYVILYLEYKYFEPDLVMDFYIDTNYRKYPPRNILTINSIKFHNISEDNIISFRLFGNSENKTQSI